MLVLYTSIPIEALRSNRAALRKIAEIEASEEIVCTTEVNYLELFKSQWSGLTTKARRHKGKFYAVDGKRSICYSQPSGTKKGACNRITTSSLKVFV